VPLLSAIPARARFGLTLAAALSAILVLPAFASAVKAPLTVEKIGTGQGTVTSSPSGINCGTSCIKAKASFSVETPITLTASPKAGSIFVSWFGCEAEPTPTTCEITIYEEEEPTVEAEFNEEKFFLFVEEPGTGQGSVTSSPAGINCGTSCEAEYLEGTKVTLTASPEAGSAFEGWTGCDAEPSGKCEVTIREETTVAAEFREIEKFPLVVEKTATGQGTVTSSPSGINCGMACPQAKAEYLEGTTVTLTASAGTGSAFEGWTGCDSQPSAAKCEVTITGETIVEAEFIVSSKPKFTLTVNIAGTGTGTVGCDGGTCASSYEQGRKVVLAASPAPGSTFSGFVGGSCSGTGSCTVTITGNTTVTATFSAKPAPTCATDPSLCPPPSVGKVRSLLRSARVKGGKATLKIACSGGTCKGGLSLAAKIKRAYGIKTLVIGTASFNLADGASTMLKVKLVSAAKQELARGKSIAAKLAGASVVSSTVKLAPAPK
jgi:hypothetical protein